MTVTNKTKTQLQIDWNKIRYLFNGSPHGLYVFRSIDAEAIKYQTIAPDIISPRDVFTKIIALQKLIAYTPFREQNKLVTDESASNGGLTPQAKARDGSMDSRMNDEGQYGITDIVLE